MSRKKGMRTRSLVVVTTLLDAEQYPAEEIALLYRRRWQAELHLKSIKIILQMDHLRYKTPERVHNEFYMHLVGYNLIRGVMAVAAQQSGACPWEISFKGTLQTLSHFLPILLVDVATEAWCEALLRIGGSETASTCSARSINARSLFCASCLVGQRVDRICPCLIVECGACKRASFR